MTRSVKVYDVRDKGECRTGFLVVRNRHVVIMHEIRDFHDDGFVAYFGLSNSKVKALNAHHVVSLGIKLKRLKPRRPTMRIKAKPTTEILRGLRASKAITLVEFKRKGKVEVFLGRIRSLDEKSFWGAFYGTNGRFYDPEQILLRSIVRIQWDDPYCRTMTKISKLKPSKQSKTARAR